MEKLAKIGQSFCPSLYRTLLMRLFSVSGKCFLIRPWMRGNENWRATTESVLRFAADQKKGRGPTFTLVQWTAYWISPQIFVKIRNGLNVYAEARGKLLHEMNLNSKISWQAPFNKKTKDDFCKTFLKKLNWGHTSIWHYRENSLKQFSLCCGYLSGRRHFAY